jgi:hypothetical protein
VSAAAKLRDAIVAVLHEHERARALPTSARFLYYELVAREVISKTKTGARRTDQGLIEALTVLREKGIIPWSWISDETRSMADYSGFPSILDWAVAQLPFARIDLWNGDVPFILTESRSLAGVLQGLAHEYAARIAATNGQANGFLHNVIAPALKEGARVLYLGDWDFAGGHIEANTRRVLEREVGPLAWERLALTEDQVRDYGLTRIYKIDGRHKRRASSLRLKPRL